MNIAQGRALSQYLKRTHPFKRAPFLDERGESMFCFQKFHTPRGKIFCMIYVTIAFVICNQIERIVVII